jgi:hypothetical protein
MYIIYYIHILGDLGHAYVPKHQSFHNNTNTDFATFEQSPFKELSELVDDNCPNQNTIYYIVGPGSISSRNWGSC